MGTDITGEVHIVKNHTRKGNQILFYEDQKYLKSGQSKSSELYRCHQHFKKCKSRIHINRETKSITKNEVEHNHEIDRSIYENFFLHPEIDETKKKNSQKKNEAKAKDK